MFCRKDAVPLVDAFDFTDKCLNSALGSYDGQVYQRLYEWAQRAPTNQVGMNDSWATSTAARAETSNKSNTDKRGELLIPLCIILYRISQKSVYILQNSTKCRVFSITLILLLVQNLGF